MKHTTLSVVLIATVTSAPIGILSAQDPPPGSFVVYGIGVSSCGAWTKDKQGDITNRVTAYDADKAWMMGFVSGIGSASASTLRKTDSDGLVTFMDSYCQAHPLDDISDAAEALAIELLKR